MSNLGTRTVPPRRLVRVSRVRGDDQGFNWPNQHREARTDPRAKSRKAEAGALSWVQRAVVRRRSIAGAGGEAMQTRQAAVNAADGEARSGVRPRSTPTAATQPPSSSALLRRPIRRT